MALNHKPFRTMKTSKINTLILGLILMIGVSAKAQKNEERQAMREELKNDRLVDIVDD